MTGSGGSNSGRSGLPKILFLYWGRRGLSRFAVDVALAAKSSASASARISVSRQNESFAAFEQMGDGVVPVDTFSTNTGALLQAWRIPILRRQLHQYIVDHQVEAVVELMPHAWSSFVAPTIKAANARYCTIVHDATTHPGDYRSASIAWLIRRTLRQADLVLTLSNTVAVQIKAGQVPHDRVHPLFHPDLDFGKSHRRTARQPGEPWRLMFFGRIMPYKGLPLFLDMVDLLRADGINVEVGVFGQGDFGPNAARLTALKAEVVNRWLSEAEIRDVLRQFDAVVLSHVEASQSGVAAAAFGAGLPVIATPVGGLVEQIEDGVTGVLAGRVDARALADATIRLISQPRLYELIAHNLSSSRSKRSVARFVEDCIRLALQDGASGTVE